MLHTTLTISPSIATAGRHHRVCVATSRRPHPHLLESGLPRSPSLAHHPWCQRHGPSLRWIRGKGSRSEIVPVTIVGPVEGRVYFLSVRKLTLAHVERQFKFNFVTWPLANALPLLVGAGWFALWGFYDGWQMHKSDDFFTVVAVVASLTALAFALWRLIVQESDKKHDSLCRRLEHELMAHNTTQMSNSVGQMLKFLQDHFGSSTQSQSSSGSPMSSRGRGK